MLLELSSEDVTVLKRALELHTKELQSELVHTTDRAYRADMRASVERLERILKEIEAEIAQGGSRTAKAG